MNPCRRRTTTRQRRAVAPVLMVALATAVAGSLVVAALRHAETPARRTASGQGYWIVARDGGLFALGDSACHGSPTASEVAYDHIVGMAATRDGEGYWVAAADGSVFTYGNAHTMGAGISGYNRPVVGIEATPSGGGYWLVAADGGVFAFGDAVYQGSTAGLDLNQDIVGLASTPSGHGYWLVGADGGIFAFGDAVYQGSAGNISLNQPVRGIASTRNGQGYWLVAADGGIFAYGDAGFEGSTAGRTLRAEIVGIARTPTSHGYWLAGRDGGIFAFGDAAFLGPDHDLDLRGPAVGVAALRNTGPGLNIASGPSQDGFTTDTTPAYAGSASDPGGSVDKVEASVDGGPFSTSGVACIACGSPFSAWDFETPELPEGLHTIRLRPVDDMGAAGDVVVRRVTVDTTDPTIGFSLAPPAGVPFRQPRPTIGGNAADVPGGVDRIEVSVDDGPFSTDGVSCNDCPGTGVAWSYTPPAPLDDGEHTVSFRAVDRAGNTSSELDSTFEVDVTVPVLLSIASTSASPVVTATFSEPVTCSTVSAADFSVTKNGAPDPVAAVGCTPPSDPTIELTLTEPPAKGEPLQVTPTDTVADPAGNPVPTVPVSTTVVSANPPLAAADSYSTDEDTTLAVATPGVLGNDPDADLEPITAVLGTGPAHGSLTLGTDGSLSYAPAADFDGSDSFTYKANDGTADSAPATVSITVAPVQDTPVAVADSYSTNEDTTLTVATAGILGNDTDADGDTLTAALVTGPSHGALTLGGDGSFTYTPSADYNGPDSFTYQAGDGTATSGAATVSITVTAVNDAPVAVADTYSTNEDTPLVVAAPGVLANDTDTEGSPLTAVLATSPAHGALTLGGDGSFTYTPSADYNGPDSFTYQAGDGTATSGAATVSITVTAVNDAPVAVADTYSTNEDMPLTVAAPAVLANDTDVENDELTTVLVSGPTHGSLTLTSHGSFAYAPSANYNGPDSFTYKAGDSTALSPTVTVSITVVSVNDVPVEGNDAYTLAEDTPLVVAAPGVLANDTDADNDALSAVKVTDPSHGTLTLGADGSFTYTPTANYNGSDSFTYKSSDGSATSSTATVTITVTSLNDTPVAVADTYTTNEDTVLNPAAPGVLSNDTDADNESLSAVKVTDPSHGTLTLGADGSFTYTPTANYNGSDSFTYKANDGTVDSAVVTVGITVSSVNDTPVAVADSYTTNEDTALNPAAPGVLSNDTDADNDTLSAVKVTDPSHGTLTLNADGSFTYTPTANYNGSDSFTYKANDGTADSSTVTVAITVTSVNDAPVAVADAYTVNEDAALTVAAPGVLSNDTDTDGDALEVALVTNVTHGTFSLAIDGSFTYTPTADYNGSDSFAYYADDGTTTSGTTTVTITVAPMNDVPAGTADAYTAGEDATLTAAAPGVLANDTDLDGDTLSAVKVTDPSHGTLTLGADGAVTYNPAANYHGPDSFTYKASDGTATSGIVTVTITVTSVNDAPVASNESLSTNEDAPLTVAAPGVLSNDTDADNDTLSAVKVTDPSHGTLSLNVDGSFTYTPTANYNGSDSFTYKADDGTATSSTATVSITVTSLNDTPVATADTYTTAEDTALNPSAPGVLSNDTDADNDTLSAVKVTDPSHGTLTLGADGSFTYTPTANYNGSDSFTYKANDGTADSNVVTVGITVTAVNDVPAATADTYTTNEDTALNPSAPGVLSNDTDADNDTLSAVKVTDPSHGTLTLNADGSYLYTPTANYNGSDSFTYKANDGTADSSTVTVAITVTSLNDTPVATADAYTTSEDTPVTVAAAEVLANDTDADADTLSAVKVTDPSHGTVSLGADGAFTYTPTANYSGSDSFTYKANDGTADSSTVTVAITVSAVNDAPVASDDSTSTNEDVPVTVAASGVLANDTDVESSPLTAAKVTDPANGSVTVNADGSFTYTPTADYSGSDSFTYKANDGTANSNTATVTITVNPVNDAPVAVGDAYSTNEDTGFLVAGPGVLGNDTDLETGTLSSIKVTDPSHGTVNLLTDGSFTYTPTANYNGSDSFTYKANDGTADSGTVTVSITVNAVNDAPAAAGDSYTAVESTPLTVAAPGLLTNDTDVEASALTAAKVTDPGHGSVTVNADGSFTYTPTAAYIGPDSFTYKANDGTADSGTATVSITVNSGNVAPVAVDDSFTGAVGNTTFAAGVSGLTVPAAFQAADIKGNDTDGDSDTLSTVAGPITSTNSGSVTMNADGTFTYIPAVGFTGTDTFDYTVSDGRGGTDTGTVSVTVASMVWYVDSDAAGGGDGRSTAPFNSLTPVNGSPDADGPGETIFLYSATNPYSGGITLEASERLIGEPSGLTVGATTLLASGGAGSATVASTTGSAVTLSTGNTLNGLAIGGASGFALSGSSVGALTVANTSVANTTGGAVSIDGGALTAAFTSVSSTGSASQGIYLNNVTGSFSAASGAIASAAGSDVKVTGGTATVSYGGSVTNTAGHSVEVGSRTGGSVTLSGAVSDTGTGVLLTSNGGSTVTFSGTLTASTGTSAAFTATGGGTVAVTGSGSTLTTTTGTALKVTSTLIGASNLTFASISSDGGSNGIYLDTTGSSGGLVVTGDGGTAANGSGGTIRNMTAGADGSTNGIGVYLNSTSNVSLEAMNLSDFSNYGIRGIGVSGFSLDRSVISGSNGNNAALDEDAVSFSGLTGTASITGSTVAGGFENDFRLINTSGTLNLTVDASTIGLNSTASGDDGIYVEAQSGATINPTVKSSTFSGTRGDMIQTNALAGSTMTLVFQNNTLSNGHSNIVSAGGGTTFSGAGTFNYTITGNSIQGSKGTALFVNSSGAGVFTGRIDNNTIGQAAVANSGSSEASGIRVESNSGGDQTVVINNNRVYQYNNQGIMLQGGDQQGNAVTFEATVTNNTVSNPGTVNTGFNAIHLNAGIVGTDTFTGCIDVRTNSISGGGKGTTPPNNADLRLRQRQSTTIRLPGYGGGAFDSSAAATFEAGQNTVSTSTASIGAGGGLTGGAACSQPPS